MAVRDLENQNEIRETYLLVDKKLKPFRNKTGNYLEVELRDSTGAIKGRLWEQGEETYEQIDKGQPVEVQGKIQEFMGELQVILTEIKNNQEEHSPEDFLPWLTEYFEVREEFLKKLEEVKERARYSAREVEMLLNKVFSVGFTEEFCKTPAAVKYHHPYLGGLMHHTLNVVKNAEALAGNYPEADKLLTLTGALLHDIGKVKEYSLSSGNIEHSVEGVLLGHIILGNQLLNETIRELRKEGIDFPEELEKLLLHLLTSHHSEGEWGSPRQPALLEALLVHQADLLDAEAYKFLACEGEAGSCQWSSLLKRKVYHKKDDWDIPF